MWFYRTWCSTAKFENSSETRKFACLLCTLYIVRGGARTEHVLENESMREEDFVFLVAAAVANVDVLPLAFVSKRRHARQENLFSWREVHCVARSRFL